MKKVFSKNIVSLCYYIFSILFGIFIGITILSIVLLAYDLLTPGFYFRGFYMLTKRLGIDFFTIIGSSFGGFGIFTSFTKDYIVSLLAFLYSSIFSLTVLYILYQLISIFKKSNQGFPFTLVIVKSIKRIGIAIICAPIVLIFLEALLVLNTIIKSKFYYGYIDYFLSPHIILRLFFEWLYYGIIGLFFLFMAEVFRRGLELQQENDLTV
ncbi:MAG: DUF2975 domain-containing protein [Bacteroidota bacterium]